MNYVPMRAAEHSKGGDSGLGHFINLTKMFLLNLTLITLVSISGRRTSTAHCLLNTQVSLKTSTFHRPITSILKLCLL